MLSIYLSTYLPIYLSIGRGRALGGADGGPENGRSGEEKEGAYGESSKNGIFTTYDHIVYMSYFI